MPLKAAKNIDNYEFFKAIQTGNDLPSPLTLEIINSAKDQNGYGLMHYAASYGKRDLVKQFVDLGGDINIKSTTAQETPLHVVSKQENSEEMVGFLLDNDADHAIGEGEENLPAIHLAAAASCLKTLELLLKRIPDALETTDLKGNTVLAHAVKRGKDKAIKWLIENGAKTHVVIRVEGLEYSLLDYAHKKLTTNKIRVIEVLQTTAAAVQEEAAPAPAPETAPEEEEQDEPFSDASSELSVAGGEADAAAPEQAPEEPVEEEEEPAILDVEVGAEEKFVLRLTKVGANGVEETISQKAIPHNVLWQLLFCSTDLPNGAVSVWEHLSNEEGINTFNLHPNIDLEAEVRCTGSDNGHGNEAP